MKYNAEYDRWVTKGGLVYRYDEKKEKLVLCKLSNNGKGYLVFGIIKPKPKLIRVHRIVYETFIGEIPQGYEIDHINTIRDDNRLENLKLCTHKENINNPLTLHKKSRNKNTKGKPSSEFGEKFKEHYGITYYENPILYRREYKWYEKHKKVCRWE